MSKRRPTATWQQSELDRYLEEHGREFLFDLKPVFLPNPRRVQQLDKLIKEGIWPAILQGLEGTGIRVARAPDGFPRSQIEDGSGGLTGRSWIFVLEDPERPLTPGKVMPWYSRGNVSCGVLHCSVRFDFHICLPLDQSLERVMEILSDPAFSDRPPSLSISRHYSEMTIEFSGGGVGWRTEDPSEALAAGAGISGAVRNQIKLTQAVDRFKGDPADDASFLTLQATLREIYGHE